MSFRARLFLATCVAVLVPLTVLALGVRREMDRRLERGVSPPGRRRGRGAAAPSSTGSGSAWRPAGRAGGGASRATTGSGSPRSRATPPRAPTCSTGPARPCGSPGLSLLQIQDSTGRILSSGHFRNEYDRMRPELPASCSPPAARRCWSGRAPRNPRCSRSPRRSGSRWPAGPSSLVGGIAAEAGFSGALDPDPDLAVALDSPVPPAARDAGAQAVGPSPCRFSTPRARRRPTPRASS